MGDLIDLMKVRRPRGTSGKTTRLAGLTDENPISLADHRLLQLYAKKERLSYRECREYLRKLDISVEQALENARSGITINDYIRERAEEEKARLEAERLEQERLQRKKRRRSLATRCVVAASGLAAAVMLQFCEPTTTQTEKDGSDYLAQVYFVTGP